MFDELRTALLAYARRGVLASSPNDIFNLLKMLPPEDALTSNAHEDLRDVPADGRRYVILGGGIPKATNFERAPEVPHFKRADGAWFEFRFILEEASERGQSLKLLAYGCEIRFQSGNSPPWIRFDLNLPPHANADGGLRSHVHPGTDDWAIAYPVLSPADALDALVWHTRSERKARALF